MRIIWQGRRGSNSQHPVLETGALPIELRPYWYENKLAEWTGLEPATPCVTGRYSNRLNYHSAANEWHNNDFRPTRQMLFQKNNAFASFLSTMLIF